MSHDLTVHEVTIPEIPELGVRVAAPADWEAGILDDPVSFLAHMPREKAGPFGDNLMVGIERLGEDAPEDLEVLQGVFYMQAFSSVPDFHAIDDRAMPVDGEDGWFRASLQTAPPGITAVNRQVFTRRGDLLVTLSLTSMAFRDEEAGELFEDIVQSCSIVTLEESA